MRKGPRMSNNVEEEEIEDSGSVLGLPEQEENAKLGRNWKRRGDEICECSSFLGQRPKSLCQRQEHLCKVPLPIPSLPSEFCLNFLEPFPGSASPTKFLNTTSTSPPNRTMFWTPFQPPPEPPTSTRCQDCAHGATTCELSDAAGERNTTTRRMMDWQEIYDFGQRRP